MPVDASRSAGAAVRCSGRSMAQMAPAAPARKVVVGAIAAVVVYVACGENDVLERDEHHLE